MNEWGVYYQSSMSKNPTSYSGNSSRRIFDWIAARLSLTSNYLATKSITFQNIGQPQFKQNQTILAN